MLQLNERKEKMKREKDEREKKERELFKLAIEENRKHDKNKTNKTKPTVSPRKQKTTRHEKDEPVRKQTKPAKKSNKGAGHRYSCCYEQCNCSFNTQAELNNHHKENHPPVQCTVCKKLCTTPNTLDRHMYKHKEQNMKCQYCKETFAFKSELEFHMAKHQDLQLTTVKVVRKVS